jgi:uncharacterized protein
MRSTMATKKLSCHLVYLDIERRYFRYLASALIPNSPYNKEYSMNSYPPLIEALRDRRCYPHPVTQVEIVQTHISWVLLAGEFAYKIKKPVNLGFLDFSTLAQRQFFCQEELRLNQNTKLYLGLSRVCGTVTAPRIEGTGEVLEYAVKMRAFAQTQRLDNLLAAGQITTQHMTALGADLAEFHARAMVIRLDQTRHIDAPIQDNFTVLHHLLQDDEDRALCAQLQDWTIRQRQYLSPILQARNNSGKGRECHGDLHVQNIALFQQRLCLFDAIEFSPILRQMDCMSELAFILMDLHAHAQPQLAAHLAHSYFEHSGDYDGVQVLRFYEVYRALVRAKIAAFSAQESSMQQAQSRHYLHQAISHTQAITPFLLIFCGLSGSGKSYWARCFMENTPALCLRADVQRKRLFGLAPLTRASAEIYTPSATQRTYTHLAHTATLILKAGYPVIIDATCLQRWQRDLFYRVAQQLGIAVRLLYLHADIATLKSRIAHRRATDNDVSDANEAVLEQQRTQQHPPDQDEYAYLWQEPLSIAAIQAWMRSVHAPPFNEENS